MDCGSFPREGRERGLRQGVTGRGAHKSMYAPPRVGAPHLTGDVAQGSLSSPAVLPVRICFQAGRGKSRLPNVRRRKGPRRLKSRRAEPRALRYIRSPVPRLREQRPLARPTARHSHGACRRRGGERESTPGRQQSARTYTPMYAPPARRWAAPNRGGSAGLALQPLRRAQGKLCGSSTALGFRRRG
jgi:hypothetical protein